MPGFGRMKRNAHLMSLILFVVQIPIIGCGNSGKTEVQKFEEAQKTFEQTIAAAGGTAELDEFSMFGFTARGWKIDLSSGKLNDSIVEQIVVAARAFPVLDLNLGGTDLNDVQLAKLDKNGVLVKVVNLDLSNTAISDEGLDKVNAVVALSFLNLEGTKATKRAAERLGKRKMANPSTPAPLKKQPELKI